MFYFRKSVSFRVSDISYQSKLRVHTEALIQIPRAEAGKSSVPHADIAVACPSSLSQSDNVHFAINDPPEMVIEITSTNYRNDAVSKVQLYQIAIIPIYVIVDRRMELITIKTLSNGSFK